jgi:pSer/pThr/pTyr-binding forkhead associated (FHA) protein
MGGELAGPALQVGSEWFPLLRPVILVGRPSADGSVVPDVDLSALDPGRATSRRHAEVTWDGAVASIRDLGSRNGTSVNGQRLAAEAVELRDGDRLSFGGIEARFAQALPQVAEPDSPEDVDQTVLGPRPRPPAAAPPQRPQSIWRRLLRRPRR